MNSTQIADIAIEYTAASARWLSMDVREQLAIARATVLVLSMDNETSAEKKITRLENAIAEIYRKME